MTTLLAGNVHQQLNDDRYLGSDSKENCDQCAGNSWWQRRWGDVDITYVLNSDGYRTKEFDEIDWENSVVLIGDSNSVGVGVPVEQTVSAILEERINRPVINLSVAGSSNMFIMYNTARLLEQHTPYAVINIWSAPARIMTFADGAVTHWAWKKSREPELSLDGSILSILESWRYNKATCRTKQEFKYNEQLRQLRKPPEWLAEYNTERHSHEVKRACRLMCKGMRHLEYVPSFWKQDGNETSLPMPASVNQTSRDCLHPNGAFFGKWVDAIEEDFNKNDWLD